MAGTIEIIFLKSEFCRFEDNFKDLQVRIKISDVWDVGEDNIFTAKIYNIHGMEYVIEDWEEVITDTTTKLIKEYDLNLVTYIIENCEDDPLPLNIGKNTLEVNINDTTVSAEFDLVAVTVDSIKSQYLLGVDLTARTELVFVQDLRQITGVEVLSISKETPVGAKEITWNFTDQTLQWDWGEPVLISDQYLEYTLPNHMASEPGLSDGDYIKVKIDDVANLPGESITETVLVDVKEYSNSDYQYWINNGLRVLTETIIMTAIEPTLYSTDKSLGYKQMQPVSDVPKRYSETSNYSFELPVNMLQCIVQLWAKYYLSDSPAYIDVSTLTHTEDGRVVFRKYPYGFQTAVSGSSHTVIGLAGLYDRTVYSEAWHGARNKTMNYWHSTVIAGLNDKELQSLALKIVGTISAIDLLLIAGLGKGAGISSRSFSVGGISSSFQTTESPENSVFSAYVTTFQQTLGIGRATKDQQKIGLINQIKNKVLGGAMGFKY
jgi:hypothetical protein